MKLKDLFNGANIDIQVKQDLDIAGITADSREVKKGFIFVAIKGIQNNGYDYISIAIEKGANVIIAPCDFDYDFNGEKIIVNDPYELSVKLAPVFYDFPSKKFNLIGITGTNGKTTTAYLLESIYREFKHKTGLIGTIKNKIADKEYPVNNTTPLALELQKLLNEMAEHKIDTVIMEVSSHGLALNRVNGCEFDTAVFTNLTQDHLDFHGNMDNYLLAKKKLFDNIGKGLMKKDNLYAVVNLDDPNTKQIIKHTDVFVMTYGENESADVCIKDTSFDIKNYTSKFRLIFENKSSLEIESYLIGAYNIKNISAAAAAAYAQKVPLDIIKQGIEKVVSIAGRFEFLRYGQEFACVIDYAHTDDALYRVITTAKSLGFNKIITVFGCGGDRDRDKRPKMGEAAAKNSDFVIITNDNPREEDSKRIALDIEVGIRKTGNNKYEIVLDRQKAIYKALQMAGKGDIIIIAGKGHEDYQIIGNQKIHFSDKETVKKLIEKMLEKDTKDYLF
ncbi:UDP-N-acetylmuramoyl-L-alanyl-D-glutamate--2,6-diaminopimelate ligase [bacterium]